MAQMAAPSLPHGRYDFRNATLIGRGEYARVYCVTDKHLSQKVAVKMQEKSKYEGKKINPLESEILALTTLSHPNVVSLVEYWEEDNKDYIVLQYARGGELLSFVTQRGPLPEPLLRNLFGQIVRAVEYAHFRQFSHRDIKLENIFLLNDMAATGLPHALLGDWGFATRFEPGVPQTIACGSLHYTSPEVATKQAYMPDKADMWSLGVVLYALAFGEFPFDSQDTRELTTAIQLAGTDGPYSIARKIASLTRGSSALKDLVLGLLEVDAQKRLTATETLAHRFFTSEGVLTALEWRLPNSDSRSVVRSSPSLQSTESLCSLVSSVSSASARLSRQNSSSSIRPTDPAQATSSGTPRSRAARTCRLHVDMVKEIVPKQSKRRARRKASKITTEDNINNSSSNNTLSWSGERASSSTYSNSISKSHSRSKSPKVAASSQVGTSGGGKGKSRRSKTRETKKTYASRSSAQLDIPSFTPLPADLLLQQPLPSPERLQQLEALSPPSIEAKKPKHHSRRTPVVPQEPSKPSPFTVLMNLIKHGRPTKNNGVGPHTN